jgi:competence protein ComEC
MIKKFSKEYFVVFILLVLNTGIWITASFSHKDGVLKVDFLDIGQGDAIFIEAPNGVQMLVDGGPDASVLRELSGVMKFGDRSIDVVLATHPDKDHVAGLSRVFESYEVKTFIDSVADADTSFYNELENKALEEKDLEHYYGMRGMTIVLDRAKGVYFEILYPHPDDLQIVDTNDLSIIGKLVYGDTSFLLTGDAPKIAEQMLVSTDGKLLESDVLKAGHHGSKTSSSQSFVEMVAPTYAIISAGKGNSYGHPHKETLQTFQNENVPILSTIDRGTIRFESDGKKLYVR